VQKLLLLASVLARVAESWKGLRPVIFIPCTPARTWGTRPGKNRFTKTAHFAQE
jgi:hypothetical protein